MTDTDIIILGAGISGLATAAALGKNSNLLILERDAGIGGYCKSIKQAGFVWDYSGHFFHFKHPEIEQWLRIRMPGQAIRTVVKRSYISYANRWLDYPFQKNIHQLPQDEFIECLYDLYTVQTSNALTHNERNFKEMLYARFGRSIAEKFLIPYNEKLYATDLSTLDRNAMGRFFPHAKFVDVIQNMKQSNNTSYNSTFTYPAGGAIEYAKALASEVEPSAIRLNENVHAIDLNRKKISTAKGDYRFKQLVTSAPFPFLLRLCKLPVDDTWRWNQVLVFNFGFDTKGPQNVHWIYYPQRSLPFYRVGFYDNIFNKQRMSIYVEVGFSMNAHVDIAQTRQVVLDGLRSTGVVTSQRLIAEHAVVMNPAYVHITEQSNHAVSQLKAQLEAHGVYSIGRYGSWTYCSIEDNILEARRIAKHLLSAQ